MDRSLRAAAHSAGTTRPANDRESLEALRATIERAPVGIAHFNRTGRFLLVNDRLCHILGRSRPELLSTTFQSITHPDDLEDCVRETERVAAGELSCYTQEKRFVDADGAEVWTRVSVSAVRDERGELLFFIGIAEDVTERRAAEQALRERDALHSVTANALRVWIEAAETSIARARERGDDAQACGRELDKITAGLVAMRRLLDAVPGRAVEDREATRAVE